ncbi:MAG: hypothetical protein GY778_10525, partial [bacterium]|nr:hypothetical protein [bacterium]
FNIVTFSITILATGVPGDGLRKVSGDNQFVLQNSAFPQPPVVLAKDDGQPQVGLMLSATPRDDVVVCTSLAFTDANGEGQISCVAGAVDENTEVKIDVADSLERELPDPFRATITTELVEADKLELLTDPMVEGDVGSTVLNAITVRALDDTEGELQGVPIYFWSTDDLSFDPAVGISDENGEATTSVTFGCPLNMGNIFVGLESAGRQIVVPFRANPGPPTLITKLQGDNQSGNPGELLDQVALLVEVTDICGNPADGEAVTWTVNPPQAAELVNFITTTDFRGRSGGLVRLGNFGGPFTITAIASGITAVFNLTVINAPAKIVAISGDGQTVALGQAAPQPLVVETRSDEDVAVGAVDLTFRVIAGSATVSPPTATTNAFGRASATVTAGDTLGPIIVEAAGPGFSIRFTLSTAGRVPALTAVSFVNGASFLTGWVPGGTGTIFGVGLMEGVVGPVFAPGPPFPTVFRGVSVSVNGRPLPILSMANVNGQEQINVQVDFDLQPGAATAVLNNNGSTASISGVQIFDVQPGVFEVSVGGGRFAAAIHADFSLVPPSTPARPGELILLF